MMYSWLLFEHIGVEKPRTVAAYRNFLHGMTSQEMRDVIL